MAKRLLLLVLALGLAGVSAGPAGARAGVDDLRIVDHPVPPASVPGDADADQILVRFNRTSSAIARAAARARAGVEAVRPLSVPGWEVVASRGGESLDEAVARLARDPDVAEVVPDLRVHPTTTPNDPHFDKQWALHNVGQTYCAAQTCGSNLSGTGDADVDAPGAWDTTTGSSSVVVAIVDTGVAYDHQDLALNMWNNPNEIPGNGIDDDGNGYVDDVRGWDWFGDENDPYDDEALDQDGVPHGTHVAGIVAAKGDNSYGVTGVGWTTKIMPLRVLGPNGGSISDILAGMSYAIAEGAQVVNMSLGATGRNRSERDSLNNLFSSVMNGAPDTLFVAAAGNSASNNEVDPLYPCAATSSNLICVAATDADDALASFSSYGSTSVDLGAPGEMILSTGAPGWLMYMSGTSMATPMVAGTAAVLLAVDPDATVAELRAALLAGGDPLSSLANKTVSGVRLNLNTAIITLLYTPIFADVAPSHPHYTNIQTIYPSITSGCATDPLRYCPSSSVTRGQMAVFLIRAMGLEGDLGPYQGLFGDVPQTHPFVRHIERLYTEGITSGCSTEPRRYCPGSSVTRGQMAVFLIRGMDHAHDLALFQGVFTDVLASNSMASYIEHLYEHDVTAGCGGGKYCPASSVTRAQMATFLVRAFGLS